MERLRSFVRRVALTLLLLLPLLSQGQDPALTNFHLSRNILNPAYAGYSGDWSVSLNNRLQWLKTSKFRQFNTYNMVANGGCERYKLGFALQALDNVEGEGFLRTTSVGGQVAYYIPFDYKANGTTRKTNSSIFAFGVQFGMSQKHLDWDKLTFSDQLSNETYQLVRTTSVVAPQNNVTENRLDLGAGMRFQSELGSRKRSSISMGLAAFHAFTNQESFFSQNSDVKWPVRYTGHLFYNHNLGRAQASKWDASLGAVYNTQAGLTNFTVMTYGAYQSTLKLGVGYRGKAQGLPDAIIIQPTFWGKNFWGKHDWLLTLGYEVTSLSSVGQHRTGGTIELGLVILFKNSAWCSTSDVDCFFPNKKMKKQGIWGY